MRNYKETPVNDSLKKISGNYSHYNISGYINAKKQKLGWWQIVDHEQGEKYNVKLQYKILDKKEKVNQYIIYNLDKGIYKINSKFYEKSRSITNDSIVYKYVFYTPSLEKKMFSESYFKYFLVRANKQLVTTKTIIAKKKDTGYVILFSTPNEENLFLVGYFWEFFANNDGIKSENQIFVEDTLKL